MVLHNRIDKRVLKDKLMEEPFSRITFSFYRYVRISDPQAFRNQLYEIWSALQCFGRIYVANEGINAQMSVPEHNYNAFLDTLQAIPALADMPIKIAVEDDGKSFYKLIIKVRQKIVNDGLDDYAYDVTNVGHHMTASEFNNAVQDPATIVVDMRNHYEYEVGHFEGAIGPEGATFRDVLPEMVERLADQKDKKIILYCTGGIRCEKASAYFRHHGFSDVNQLLGGIIDYARQIKVDELDNKYLGKNFVFDDRLGERISDEVISHCHQCGAPCDTHTNCANQDCHILFIQCDACRDSYEACCSVDCRDFNRLPEEEKAKQREHLPTKATGEKVYSSKLKQTLQQRFSHYECTD